MDLRIMKPTFLFTSLALLLATPALHAKTELETLRALCKEQERQIHQLEDSNAKLRGVEPPARTAAVAKSETAAPAAPAASAASGTYTVKAGDSFARIARKVGTTPLALAKTNGLKTSAIIRPGQKLKVPGSVASAAKPAAAIARSGAATHKVVQGETFYSISKKHGISTAKLVAANPSINPATLRPGQVVSLVAGASSTTMIANSTPQVADRSAAIPAARTPAAVPNNIPVSTPPPRQAAVEAAATPAPAPAPTPAPAEAAAPAPAPEGKIQAITIDSEITYGEFASKHGTETSRLNALNGLDLTGATVLAKGSELYVPGQP